MPELTEGVRNSSELCSFLALEDRDARSAAQPGSRFAIGPQVAKPRDECIRVRERVELDPDHHIGRIIDGLMNLECAHAEFLAQARIAIEGGLPAGEITDRVLDVEDRHASSIGRHGEVVKPTKASATHAMMQGGMDWNDLRYFLAACRHGSLAGAARELGCEYTTVGRRIAALETALGSTLFVRTPDGLTLTPSGEQLVPLAEQIERAAGEITLRAAGHDQRAEGIVRLTCAEGFSAYIVQQLPELRAQHPGLVVEILDDIRPLDLARNEADFAIRLMPSTQRELMTRSLCEMKWRMFASESYVTRRGRPSPIDQLRGHDVIGFDDRLANVPGAVWLAEHAREATIVLRGNSLHAILDAAATGIGLAVLPHYLATRDGRLQLIAPDVLGTRTLSLVVHADLQKVARVRITMDFFAAAIRRDHAAGLFG